MSEPVLDDSPPTIDPPATSPPVEPPLVVAGVRRQVTEFLILLVAGILVLRYFVAEAYVVPTGSMAPTILGFHGEFDCPNCHDPLRRRDRRRGSARRAAGLPKLWPGRLRPRHRG